ncbi:MAG: DNA-processing protein DprA [Gammaproteobacteria bacterium]|nr:DNA-processing protein DprA [Gammaproteobacteria bacterium]
MDNLHTLLACNRIVDLGPRRLMRCQERWPDLADMFRASAVDLKHAGLPEKVADAIATFDFRQIESDLAWMQQPDHHILAWGSPEYPALLAEIYDPPPILYARGNLQCFTQTALGMVGSRHPSASGAETAWQFANELAQVPLTIVSGLALGIDAQVHEGCLAAGGATIAVLGTGIDLIYPYRHRTLADRIVAQGLLLSEFPLNSPPNAGHFPRRNRIISGLSAAILVVEAAVRSGSLITARFAMEQNRDVLAIPGSIHLTQARGCHRLLQQGASLVTSVQEVKEEMRLADEPLVKDIPIFSKICDNQSLLSCIGFETTTVDHILIRSKLSLDELLCAVAKLELEGWIQSVPGGYMRCR